MNDMQQPSMGVNIGPLRLNNPVMTASGTFGYGLEYRDFVDLTRLGAFIVKGTTLEPRQGNDYPRMANTPAGMLNAVGLQNGGVENFCTNIWPLIDRPDMTPIVNVSGASIEDYVAVSERLAALDNLRAIEVNISCPNVKEGGMAFGTTAAGAAAVTAAVRRAWPRTLIVKLSPNVTDITAIARAVQDAGADAVSLINTLLGMAVDVRRRRACLSTVTGGLSGACVKPVALRMVWQTARAVDIPVIGLGGISSTDDALEFIMAGATAIQIGTANFIDPAVSQKVVQGLEDYCRQNRVASINDLRGCINA